MTFAALALAALIATGVGDTEMPGIRKQAIQYVNDLRSQRGLDSLRVNWHLNPYLRSHTQAMRDSGGIYHSTENEMTAALDITPGQDRWALAGENVGMGSLSDPGGLFKAFRQSPEHRRNMLRPRYNRISVGVARNPETGQLFLTYWFYDQKRRRS